MEINLTKQTKPEPKPRPEPEPPDPVEELLKVGSVAPNFKLPKLDGGTMSLKETRGKVVLIDFWASWCGPCKAEIPHVQNLYEKYEPEGLVVLGVNVWERGTLEEIKVTVKEFKDEYKLTYDILLDTDRAVPNLYRVPGIPTVYLLDRDGIIVWTHIGYGPGGEVEMEKQIVNALFE